MCPVDIAEQVRFATSLFKFLFYTFFQRMITASSLVEAETGSSRHQRPQLILFYLMLPPLLVPPLYSLAILDNLNALSQVVPQICSRLWKTS